MREELSTVGNEGKVGIHRNRMILLESEHRGWNHLYSLSLPTYQHGTAEISQERQPFKPLKHSVAEGIDQSSHEV